MTDKEIIKALECCILGDCQGCFYGDTDQRHCKDDLMKNTLDLINRQQAEIEKLNVELVGMRGACNSYKMHYDNAKAEIEKLERVTSYLEGVCESTPDKVRAEAIKEFAERLKINYSKPLFAVGSYNEFIREVDNLVKEMVGDDK